MKRSGCAFERDPTRSKSTNRWMYCNCALCSGRKRCAMECDFATRTRSFGRNGSAEANWKVAAAETLMMRLCLELVQRQLPKAIESRNGFRHSFRLPANAASSCCKKENAKRRPSGFPGKSWKTWTPKIPGKCYSALPARESFSEVSTSSPTRISTDCVTIHQPAVRPVEENPNGQQLTD